MISELSSLPKVVGVKQSLKAVREGRARQVFLACDADPAILSALEALCAERGVPVERSATMAELGRAGAISIGASAVTVTSE